MATKKSVKASIKKAIGGNKAKSKGRVHPNVPKAGVKPGHRYCGGGKKA